MTHGRNEARRIESLLDWHANLIAQGNADRATAMVDRVDEEPGTISLLVTAEAVGQALAPVRPDPGFRQHLRDVLACPEADLTVLDHEPLPGGRRWTRLVPGRLGALRGRGWQQLPSPTAASRRTRRLLSSIAAASLVGLAAAWGIGRLLRRTYVAPRHNAPATGSAGRASAA